MSGRRERGGRERSVEGEECGGRGVWRERSVEEQECGGRGVYTVGRGGEGVEECRGRGGEGGGGCIQAADVRSFGRSAPLPNFLIS